MDFIHIIQKAGIIGLAILLAFFMLFLAGVIAIAITRSRRAVGLFALLAFFPLLLGLFGTYMGYRQVDDYVRINGRHMSAEELNHPQSIVAVGRHEAKATTLMGSAATAVLLVVAGCGMALTKKPETETLAGS